MPLTEQELAARCARGEKAAWLELLRDYQRGVLHMLWRYGPRDEAADLCQEVWARLLRNDGAALRSYQGGSLKAFLGQVAKTVAIDRARALRVRPQEATDDEPLLHAPDAAPSAEAALQDEQHRRKLAAALEQVAQAAENPGRDRDILRLHFVEGMSAREIADMGLGLPHKGVEAVLRRARDKLQELLQEGT